MPITDFLEKNARLYPYDIALVEVNPAEQPDKETTWREYNLIESPTNAKRYRRTLSWREFDLQANRMANYLLAHHVKKGEKVALLLMNCLEWLPVYFGILKAGAVAVPMNYRYTAEEISYCLDLADVTVLIFGKEFIERIDGVREDLYYIKQFGYLGEPEEVPSYAADLSGEARFYSTDAPAVEVTDDDNGAIYFSSGTTGFPKAILHAHRALMASAMTEQKHHGQTREDVFLCIPPLYHTGAKMHWFGSLISGGRTVLLRGVKPEWVIETASAERASIVWLLVPWAQDILDAIDRGDIRLGDYRLEKWRLMHIGAQPVPKSLIMRWKQVFPHHDYDTNYGLSESIGPGCVHLGIENIDHVGAIGKAGYLWETKIIGEDGLPVEQGKVGELCVKGPGVMLEYYKNREATDEVLRGGWLLTGDMAREDGEGFIYLVDRKKDVIITGGENLYPVQIEDFLRAHPRIKDVAVIGLPDERLGEIAAAIIAVKDGMTLTEEEVNAFCMDLPRYKRPRKLIFSDVPRNPTGKIEKPKLRAIYGATRLVESESIG